MRNLRATLPALVFSALLGVAPAQLPLQKGDTICIIGNGLPDRMQHDGWVETLSRGGAMRSSRVL